MRQTLVTLLAVASLLLCGAVLADLVARRGHMDWVEALFWHTDDTVRVTTNPSITTRHGVAMFSWNEFAMDIDSPAPATHFDHGTAAVSDQNWRVGDSMLGRAGFGFHINRVTKRLAPHCRWVIFRHVDVPRWLVAIVLALLPASRFINWSKRRYRTTRNLCVGCGYDLRATSTRCPECGVAVARSSEILKGTAPK
jgi:predicted RNA-binding Zn-ribbon protein involved in translation (DUF1610 family)